MPTKAELQADLTACQVKSRERLAVIEDLRGLVATKDQTIADRDRQITSLNGQLTSLHNQILSLQQQLADCQGTKPPPPPPPPPTTGVWRPYNSTSPFNNPIGNRAVHPESDAIMAQLWQAGGKFPSKINAGGEHWTHPYYFAKAGDPEFTIRLEPPSDWGMSPVTLPTKYRIPDQARQALPSWNTGGDAHLCAIDLERDVEIHLWQVKSKPQGGGTLVASWGGPGKPSGEGIDYPKGVMGNATAAHFGLPLGLLTPEELLAGKINHAFFAVTRYTSTKQKCVYPANGGASQAAGNWPVLGQRMFLTCTAEYINGRQIPQWQKTILHGLREYGTFVGDTGGGNNPSIVMPSSPLNATSFGKPNPWLEAAPKLGIPVSNGIAQMDLTNAVDWSYLKILA